MSDIFNPLPPCYSSRPARGALRVGGGAEQSAIEALERGLAFDDDGDTDANLQPESPEFERTLQAFATMGRN